MTTPFEPKPRTVRIPLLGLPCIAGDRLPLERALDSVRGVIAVYVNPVSESAHLCVDPRHFDLDEARATIERLGGRTLGSQTR